jgi:hypothetical protein
MRGWAILRVRVPVEPAVLEVLAAAVVVVFDVFDVDVSGDVVEDEDTIGISM